MMPIWFLISDETKDKIKAVMPKTWRPPGQKDTEVKPDPRLETDVKVDSLSRNNPYMEF